LLRVIGGGGKGAEYVDSTVSAGTAATHTFSNHAIGDNKPNRYTLVIVDEADALTGIASVTVGGNSATLAAQRDPTTFWIAAAPSGTTADIVVTADAGGDGQLSDTTVHVINVWGLDSATVTDADVTGSAADPYSTNLSTAADAMVFAIAVTTATSESFSWSGGTVTDADEVYEADTDSAGRKFAIVLKTGIASGSITITSTYTAGAHLHVSACWS
jgi:hypothetical protein